MGNWFKTIFSCLSTTLVFMLGGWDVALQTLVAVMVLDYITGFAKGYVNKNLSSEIGMNGLVKKICVLCMVALAVMVDNVTGGTGFIRTAIIYYLVANEGLSIIENLGELNILVPDSLKEKLVQLKSGKEIGK